MFEDIVVKNEKKINEWDISLIDLLEMKSQVIRLQEETIKNQRKDIIHYDGLLYKKTQLLLKAEEEIKTLHATTNIVAGLLKEAQQEIEKLRLRAR